jgi:molecular chaperone GrpE
MSTQPENKPEHIETLAQRSARLEAEAKALSEGKPMETGFAAQTEAPAVETSLLEEELAQTKDQMIRALAEVENIRKRSQKEREDATKYAATAFAKDILDVADNLRRALDALPLDLIEAEPRLKNLVDGIQATERTLLKNFEKHGICKIEPLNEPFNPNFHEVMFESSVPGKPAGMVMQVLEAGYVLNDRLLRPARVGVVKDEGQGANGHSGGHIDTSA